MELSRRDVLRAGAAAALATSTPLSAQSFLVTPSSELLPRSGKRRVVVAGGGWGGMTAARHLRQLAPDLEVVLLERNPWAEEAACVTLSQGGLPTCAPGASCARSELCQVATAVAELAAQERPCWP